MRPWTRNTRRKVSIVLMNFKLKSSESDNEIMRIKKRRKNRVTKKIRDNRLTETAHKTRSMIWVIIISLQCILAKILICGILKSSDFNFCFIQYFNGLSQHFTSLIWLGSWRQVFMFSLLRWYFICKIWTLAWIVMSHLVVHVSRSRFAILFCTHDQHVYIMKLLQYVYL